MKYIYTILLFIASLTASFSQSLEQQFDDMLNAQYPADEPGAAVIVAKEGEIIYHKGFGIANMELDVKMEKDMIFQIGSITKQFTAVAILMLAE